MSNVIIEPDVDTLVSIFCPSPDLEVVPEPYRLQKDVYVRIPYKLFLTFARDVRLPYEIRGLELSTVRSCISRGDPKVYRYYMKYLSIAQLKEVHYAYKTNSSYATRYIPFTKHGVTKSIEEMLNGYNQRTAQVNKLLSFMNSNGFSISISEYVSEYVQTSLKMGTYYYMYSLLHPESKLDNLTVFV